MSIESVGETVDSERFLGDCIQGVCLFSPGVWVNAVVVGTGAARSAA